jgi:hypothetical protein
MGRVRKVAVIGVAQAAALAVVLHGCNLDLKPFVEPDATPFAPLDATPVPTVDSSVPGVDAAVEAGPGDSGPPIVENAKRVFVTSAITTGALGSIDGADKICQNAATTAKLNGSFTAWLSVTGQPAILRLRINGPWYLVDRRTRVFASKAAVVTTGPEVPIQTDENGKKLDQTAGLTWTGTTAGGTESPADQNCTGFTAELGSGAVGDTTKTGAKWTESGLSICATALHLYCFEQ